MGHYIDKSEPNNGMFECTKIYVEVDLEKRLDNWSMSHDWTTSRYPSNAKLFMNVGIFQRIVRRISHHPNLLQKRMINGMFSKIRIDLNR
jgi:hypothetical protein